MAVLKMTFTLDSQTTERIENAADRLSIPKSQVIREAVAEFHERLGRLSEKEKKALLETFDTLVPRIAPRPSKEVDEELAEVRQARRGAGRRTPVR